MILVDMNQVMISNMMMQIGNHQNAQVDENMLRHMILNTLRFKQTLGFFFPTFEIVLNILLSIDPISKQRINF